MSSSTLPERLNKYLADCSIGSRRQIDEWIQKGRLLCDGRPIALGQRYEGQALKQFSLDGKSLEHMAKRDQDLSYILAYYKPIGEISSKRDPLDRSTIFDRLPPLAPHEGRWIQIGRLDIQTSGLLLFTNDGEIAQQLMHPSSEIEREYLVKVQGVFNPTSRAWSYGVDVGDNSPICLVSYELLERLPKAYWIKVVLKEGRNRAVRRFFEGMGSHVVKLSRIRYGCITLAKEMKPGQHRFLNAQEKQSLLQLIQ